MDNNIKMNEDKNNIELSFDYFVNHFSLLNLFDDELKIDLDIFLINDDIKKLNITKTNILEVILIYNFY